MNEHLSQEEIDTLLKGVDNGEIDTKSERLAARGEVVPYEFGSQDLTDDCHLPAMDRANERFARAFEKSISTMLRKSVEVVADGVRLVKFVEFTASLKTPINLNLVSINPLHGAGLFVIEPDLVLTTVDNFFGGDGRYQVNIEDREFTPTENRVIRLLLDRLMADLAAAWQASLPLDLAFIRSEVDPQFANIAGADEAVAVSAFKIEMEGGSGVIQIVIPNSMLEPIRHLESHDAGAEQNDVDQNWIRALKDGIRQAVVEIDCCMAHTRLSVSDVLKLNPGDVIPVELSEMVTVRAMHTPIFRGVIGVSNGRNAVQFVTPVERPDYSHD